MSRRARAIVLALLAATVAAPALPPASGSTRALDVFLLVDTTTSSTTYEHQRTALLTDLADAMRAAYPNARLGIGTVTDLLPTGRFPAPHRDPGDAIYAYRLRQPITADRASVRNAIRQVTTGGGGDEPEAQLVGLLGALGVEQPPTYSDTPDDAGFRPAATKLVVLVTDGSFHEDGGVEQWRYPTVAETARELRAHGVRVVGVVPQVPWTEHERAVQDMTHLAGLAGVRAARHYDVDGDGTLDIRQGAPLVFEWRAPYRTALARAIADAVRHSIR